MKFTHALRVVWGAARLGFRHILGERLTLFGNFFLFALLIIAYSGVFRWIPPEDLARHHLIYAQMVWYLGVTEFTLFCSSPFCFKVIQNDIQTEQIHLHLLRPCPVWIVRLGEWSGHFVGRFCVMVLPAFLLTAWKADGLIPTSWSFLGVLIGLACASVIYHMSFFMIGITCLWLPQAEPVHWLWQKCTFLFGALLWPLALYPSVLQGFVWFTPFPALLAASGTWVLDGNLGMLFLGLLAQFFWVAVFLFLGDRANRLLLNRIQNEGG